MEKLDIKLIGRKVRKLREESGLTREQFCKTNINISVKQLMRIEQGKCMPTVATLHMISKCLEIPLSILLGEQHVPTSYYNLKYQLIKTRTFCEKILIEQKRMLIDEIYSKYCEILPESELLTLDIIERILDYIELDDSPTVKDLFGDDFSDILTKEKITINDLLLINYYVIQCYFSGYSLEEFEKYYNLLLNYDVFEDELCNIQFVYILVGILYIYDREYRYNKDMTRLIEKINELIEKNKFFEIKPIILIMEAKYYLFSNKDKKKAAEKYEHASILLKEFGESIFIS